MISVPMHLKKSIGRTIVQHPTRVTSIMIRNELKELGMLGSSDASAEVVQDFLKQDEEIGDLYENHCVTIEALRQGFSREHIVPLSVYFDGVQYSKNENFLGFMSPTYAQKNKGWFGCYVPRQHIVVFLNCSL